jgi:integrase
VTFGDIVTLFLTAQAKRLKPRSLMEVERHLSNHAKPLHSLPVAKISRENIADLLKTLASNSGPVASNRVRASISAMLNWAMKDGKAESNPAAFTNKQAEHFRSRILKQDEIARVWAALPQGDFGTIVRLLILTGQRRAEIGDLRHSEIDLKRGTITLPVERTKNGRQHVVPISEPMRALIKAIPQTDGRDFVFGYGDGGFAGWSKSKERLDATLDGLSPWTLHDIRRTVATGMADIGIQPHVIEATLNHVSGHKSGVAGIYNLSTYTAEVRDALILWGEHVLKIVGEGPAKRRKSGHSK